ncbi:Error-prone repair protein ImuA [Dyadobacter sp. CY261]|uniref:ImuA family protein n=1 Tax=Dyadobacter sp. CY261 TaxID=2907203 RepID=UPI001F36B902|nr:Error-prone repair protein ImuA [Dyadobacter sp. CY261]MCF0072473.1 Error-prone repair protein ImuA [Dyadobacter sp. CY261]
MEARENKSYVIAKLRSEIMSLQGFRSPAAGSKPEKIDIGPVSAAFTGGIFPKVGVHEFISSTPESAAATAGFMATLAGQLMKEDGICLWVSSRRRVFPLALGFFGIEPDRVIFVDLKKDKDLLWTIEEGLKCDALSAVVGEVKELNLTESRRLQLAVEESKVTGLLHRVSPRLSNPVASVCRWRVNPLPSGRDNTLPGIGFPRWDVQIEKVRNGQAGRWQVQWSEDHFEHIGLVRVVPSRSFSKVG